MADLLLAHLCARINLNIDVSETMRIVLFAIKYVGLALCLLQLAMSWRELSDPGVRFNTVWLIGVIAVLLAIPTRRRNAVEPRSIAADTSSVAQEKSATVASSRRPLGWSWAQWIVVVGLCALLIGLFGGSAKNRNDQGFLYGVILLQAIVLAGMVRAIGAMFVSSATVGVLGRLALILVLGLIMFLLTLCSQLAQHGWG